MKNLRAVLFDLDGTVVDTAPDMVAALYVLMRENGVKEVPYELARSAVSHGAARVVAVGFPDTAPEQAAALQKRFLDIYRGALTLHSRLFPGMDDVLKDIERRGLRSGIVTNKAAWLSEPLLEQMGLRSRFACVVSGDTLPQRKPHPAPLLHAASLAGAAPADCIYVGDAERDVQAAHAAGMPALVANYGYLRADEDSRTWRADAYLERAADLLTWLTSNLGP
jgi:N-acetyl-D-muramate 6-phosphate phosphatase